jgi:tRNA A-37 threonylcarbamoyl transferase component Bud32/tetratricopeptide (TPR) repeat protein
LSETGAEPISFVRGDLAPGTIISDQYKVIGTIGGGAMGTVYKAQDIRLENFVAVKILRHSQVSRGNALTRFAREAKVLAALSHRNIVRILAIKLQDEQPYLVMEFIEGRSLAQLLQNKESLSAARATHIFLQMAKALAHAHSQGVIHRDVKPSNLILINEGAKEETVKLVDFGLAKLLDDPQNATRSGSFVGTLSYVSPEQCSGGTVDARSDIYSFGCVLYEAITGDVPFDGDSPLAVVHKHINEPLPPIAKVEFKQLAQIIERATAKDPQKRFQSMEEIIQSLQSESGSASSGTITIKENSSDKRHSSWLVACTGAAICAALLLCLVYGFEVNRETANHARCEKALAELKSQLDKGVEPTEELLQKAKKSRSTPAQEVEVMSIEGRMRNMQMTPPMRSAEIWKEAIALARKHNIKAASPTLLLASSKHTRGSFDAAARILKEEINCQTNLHVSPTDSTLRSLKEHYADALAADGNIEEALNVYHSLPNYESVDARTLNDFCQAERLGRSHYYAAALKIVRTWLHDYRQAKNVMLQTAHAHNLAAIHLMRMGKEQQSLAELNSNLALENLLTNQPDAHLRLRLIELLAVTYMRRGAAFQQLHQYPEAIAATKRAVLFADMAGMAGAQVTARQSLKTLESQSAY